MILWYSLTGNSEYVAEVLQSVLKDESVSLNDLIGRRTETVLTSPRPFVFVVPTYGWRIPERVDEFIRSARFTGSQEVYFILTCAQNAGATANYIQSLCQAKSFVLKGMTQIVMPIKEVVLENSGTDFQHDRLLRQATDATKEAGKIILADEMAEGTF